MRTSRVVPAFAVALGVAVVAGMAVVMLGFTQPSWADCPPDPVDERGVCLTVTIPSTPPTSEPAPPGSSGTDPGSINPCPGAPNGVCVDSYGAVWVGPPHNCYGYQLNPQPPADSELWHGNDPTKGKVWGCDTDFADPSNTFYVPDGQPVIDPGQVAKQLTKSAPFELAKASIAPPPTYHTYISYQNWLWIPEGQWHDVSVSQSVGGATVTITAKPTHVNWNMGNGKTTSCVGAGKAWVNGMPENAPTNCSYAYTEMKDPKGDKWTVSARINYTVSWTCSGNCGGTNSGDLGDVTALAGESTTVTVLQRQTVVR